MPKNNEQKKNKKITIIAVVMGGIVLAGAGYLLWQKSIKDNAREAARHVVVAPVPIPYIEEPAPVAPIPQIPETEPEPLPEPPAPPTTTMEAPPPAPVPVISPCEQATRKMDSFFTHLDQQEYIAKYALKNGSKKRLSLIAEKLYANPPVVMRETDDIFSIIKNSAHFYRVLGKDNLMLLKDVLDHETNDLEPIMADFYQWLETEPTCDKNSYALHLPVSSLYEYAGFFLNTLGGQSYLFRRESKIRMLIKYYSVLIIDQANEKGLNHHGLDIRAPLRSTIDEMEVSLNLTQRETYLENLLVMQAKYQEKYGK